MNRNEEWRALLSPDAIPIPAALEGTVVRARRRKRRGALRRRLGIPAASLAGAAALFVLLVNLSPAFAAACGSVPVLRPLAAAVAFSDSLKAAVLNGYYRVSGQTQTRNGVTVLIQYVIADRDQVEIFYTAEAEDGRYLEVIPTLMEEDGVTPLHGYSSAFAAPNETGDSLRHFSVLFTDIPVPDTLHLACTVRAYAKNAAEAPVEIPEGTDSQPLLQTEEFLFQLPLNAEDIRTGETIDVGRSFTLDGQHIRIDTVDIYPTHAQVNVSTDPANTRWLQRLYLRLEDENGVSYGAGGVSVSAIGEAGTPAMVSYRLDSPYFTYARHLTLLVSGADWMDKEDCWLEDLEVGATCTEGLPETITSVTLTRSSGGLEVEIAAPCPEGQGLSGVMSWAYRDGGGTESRFTGGSFLTREEQNRECFRLEDYPWDTISLQVSVTHRTVLSDPISVPIR